MKRFILLLISFACMANAFCIPDIQKRKLKVITLSGNGYERGLQYGQMVKKELGELMKLWKSDLQNNMHMPADSFLHHFLGSTDFIPAIKKYTPDIWEEVKGIAAGSGQPFTDVLAFQLVDEYWVYANKLMNDTAHHHCSDIGVPARNGKPAYVSQNMDLDSWMDGYQVVLHIKKHGNTPEQYILSCAGLVALTGINEYGVGICVNTLMQLQANNTGLPVAFVMRGFLERKTSGEVLDFVQNTKHASGQNYTIGTVDSVYDFEASANKVVRFSPDASGLVYHTNHPIVNHDLKPWFKAYYQQYLAGNTQKRNSEIRFATVKKRIGQSEVQDDTMIKTILRSTDDTINPVCRPHLPNDHTFTFGSVILTLSGVRTLQVTAGPPNESEYQTFSFKN